MRPRRTDHSFKGWIDCGTGPVTDFIFLLARLPAGEHGTSEKARRETSSHFIVSQAIIARQSFAGGAAAAATRLVAHLRSSDFCEEVEALLRGFRLAGSGFSGDQDRLKAAKMIGQGQQQQRRAHGGINEISSIKKKRVGQQEKTKTPDHTPHRVSERASERAYFYNAV